MTHAMRRAPARMAVLMLLAAAAAGDPRTAGAQQGTGSVTGVVFDSLLGGPLAGARVSVRGGAQAALADGGGRFTLDGLPAGPVVLLFEHPDLDSIGLSSQAARVDVRAGATTAVVLATRSPDTLRRLACRSGLPGPLGDSAVVFGDVRDAETGIRLAGARITVAWTATVRAPDGRIRVDQPVVAATTDSLGTFYACGVPRDLVVSVQARADSFATGVTEMLVGPRGFHRRDLAVSRERVRAPSPGGPTSTAGAAVVRDTAGAPRRRGLAVLAGTVLDERGQPRAGAMVTVDDAAGEALTDERGRFALPALPSGTRMAMARLVGYAATRTAVSLRNRDTVQVLLRIRSITLLDTITVVANSRIDDELVHIRERLAASSGYYLSAEEIRVRGTTRSLFDGIPSIVTEGIGTHNFRLYIRSGGARQLCVPDIFIDGMPGSLQELMAYRNDHLVALEVYPRVTAALGRFGSFNACGVVLAWTRFLR